MDLYKVHKYVKGLLKGLIYSCTHPVREEGHLQDESCWWKDEVGGFHSHFQFEINNYKLFHDLASGYICR